MADALLHIESLCKSFGSLAVLNNINAEIHAGELVAIQGASGTGKSTLLNIIGLLDKADSGTITLNQEIISSNLNIAQQSLIRGRDIGFIFQAFHLLPEFSVLENVLMPLRCLKLNPDDYVDDAIALLKEVGLQERQQEMPTVLSGGERQRVAVCRALIHKPKLILADEPTGNLDPDTTQQVLKQMINLSHTRDSAVLLVSHDQTVCEQADRILQLDADGLHEK